MITKYEGFLKSETSHVNNNRLLLLLRHHARLHHHWRLTHHHWLSHHDRLRLHHHHGLRGHHHGCGGHAHLLRHRLSLRSGGLLVCGLLFTAATPNDHDKYDKEDETTDSATDCTTHHVFRAVVRATVVVFFSLSAILSGAVGG